MASQRSQLLGTLAGVLVLAAAIAAGGWWGVWLPSQASLATVEADGRELPLQGAKLTGVTIRLGGEATTLQRAEKGWRIVAPIEARADEAALEALVGRLTTLRALRTVTPDGGDGATFGLAPPSTRLELSREGGASLALELGARNEFDGSSFARIAGTPRVFSIDAATRKALELGLDALRDRRVVPARDTEITSLALTSPTNRWTLRRDGPKRWRLDQPGSLRADTAAVRVVLFAATDWRGQRVAAESGDPAAFGIGAPDGTRLVFGLLDGRSIEVEVGWKDGKVYVRPDGAATIWEVSAGFLPRLDVPAEGLVDRTALGFDRDAVREWKLEAGAEVFVVQRKPGAEAGWQLLQPRIAPLDTGRVQAVVAALAALRTDEWPADDPAAAEARGLQPPTRTITLLGDGGVVLDVESADEVTALLRACGGLEPGAGLRAIAEGGGVHTPEMDAGGRCCISRRRFSKSA